MMQILPHINGVNHVKRISTLSGIDAPFLLTTLHALLHFNLIAYVDV